MRRSVRRSTRNVRQRVGRTLKKARSKRRTRGRKSKNKKKMKGGSTPRPPSTPPPMEMGSAEMGSAEMGYDRSLLGQSFAAPPDQSRITELEEKETWYQSRITELEEGNARCQQDLDQTIQELEGKLRIALGLDLVTLSKGDQVKFYSEEEQAWFGGEVISVVNEGVNEGVKLKYRIKNRYQEVTLPFSDPRTQLEPLTIKIAEAGIGGKVNFYSTSAKLWTEAIVINVTNGELVLHYEVDGTTRQRMVSLFDPRIRPKN